MKISTSLRSLLSELSADSTCCRLVVHALSRIESGKRSRLLNPSPCGDYWTYRESEGLITYCPSSRTQVVNDDGTWARAGRQGMKPAKFLREILAPRLVRRIKDNFFADFATKFAATEKAEKLTFEFVDFEQAYKLANYAKSAQGITSCMWDENIGPFYSAYPARALVCVDGTGEYHGRALVWEKVSGLDTPLMDRVYAATPDVAELFFREAAKNGWTRKAEQNNSCFSSYIAPDGVTLHKSCDGLSVDRTGSTRNVEYWPYLDTFRAMSDNGTLYNSNDEAGATAILDDTNGGRTEVDEHEGQTECADGEWYDSDECFEVNGRYYHQDSDDIVTCGRSGEYILRADAYCVEVSRNNTIYLHEDYVSRA